VQPLNIALSLKRSPGSLKRQFTAVVYLRAASIGGQGKHSHVAGHQIPCQDVEQGMSLMRRAGIEQGMNVS
jgi:hypothetical protein